MRGGWVSELNPKFSSVRHYVPRVSRISLSGSRLAFRCFFDTALDGGVD